MLAIILLFYIILSCNIYCILYIKCCTVYYVRNYKLSINLINIMCDDKKVDETTEEGATTDAPVEATEGEEEKKEEETAE